MDVFDRDIAPSLAGKRNPTADPIHPFNFILLSEPQQRLLQPGTVRRRGNPPCRSKRSTEAALEYENVHISSDLSLSLCAISRIRIRNTKKFGCEVESSAAL